MSAQFKDLKGSKMSSLQRNIPQHPLPSLHHLDSQLFSLLPPALVPKYQGQIAHVSQRYRMFLLEQFLSITFEI